MSPPPGISRRDCCILMKLGTHIVYPFVNIFLLKILGASFHGNDDVTIFKTCHYKGILWENDVTAKYDVID